MPTYKTIRVPIGRTGKTRLQRVQVLASGKYKFVKNLTTKRKKKKGSKKGPKRVRTVRSKVKRSMGNKRMFKTMGASGALEDFLIGYLGQGFFSGMGAAALPFTRTLQGISGHALNRRGKGRMMYGILDLIATYAAMGYGLGGIVDELTQVLKIRV